MVYPRIMSTPFKIVLCTILILAGLFGPRPSAAAPTRYHLDTSASKVGFIYILNGVEQSGTMPVIEADLMIDPQDLAAAEVDVTVSVRKARTGLIFATSALKAASVLDAAQFPAIRFLATEIQLGADGRISEGATIIGDVTMRGITRPIAFEAQLYRIQGTRPDDLSQLTMRLTGEVSRSDFGASGYSEFVGDIIKLDIHARIEAER